MFPVAGRSNLSMFWPLNKSSSSTCSSGSWLGNWSKKYCQKRPKIFGGVLNTLRTHEAIEGVAELCDAEEGGEGVDREVWASTGGNGCGGMSLNRLGI